MQAFGGDDGELVAVAWRPDGRVIATGSGRGVVQLWEPANGVPLQRIEVGVVVASLAWSADGRLLVTGHWDRVGASMERDERHCSRRGPLLIPSDGGRDRSPRRYGSRHRQR